MPDTSALLGFIVAALILLLTPGPGVLYVVTRSLTHGVRGGIISACGLASGVIVHVAAAAIGLSAILVASATAFTIIKSLGAAYLIYLGVRALVSKPGRTARDHSIQSVKQLFVDGVLVSLFNPKLALFFLAFLPQFIDPRRGNVPQQIVTLGLVYIGLALITDSGYALAAGRMRRWIAGAGSEPNWPRYVSGTVYIGLGITTALTDRRA